MVPGIGRGGLVQLGKFAIPAALPRDGVSAPGQEWRRLEAALEKLNAAYDQRLDLAKGIEAALLKVHRSIARDLEFRRHLQTAVTARSRTAAGAVEDAESHFSKMLMAAATRCCASGRWTSGCLPATVAGNIRRSRPGG